MIIELPRPHKGGQRALYLHPARFHVVACGRQWGKTQFGKIITVEAIIKHGATAWWVSPTYKMSSAIWRNFVKLIGGYASWVNSADRIMEFPNGASLTIWSGDKGGDSMRGGAPDLAIIDEAAMIKSGDMWNAVIRPALMTKQGRAMFLSTPRGHNWFWQLFNMGNDPMQPDYKSWSFPSVYNPIQLPGEIEQARATLPDRLFRQEYLAEFIEDAGGVFRNVIQCCTSDNRAPYVGRFVFGIDWGRENDYTVVSVIDAATNTQVDMDRINKVSWEHQRTMVKRMFAKWKPFKIVAEENSMGSVNIEALEKEGIKPIEAFTTTAQTKPPLIEGLALAIERGDIQLLNDRVQVAELQAYEMERTLSGSFRYNAPAGGHDDTVMALALAWHGVRAKLKSQGVKQIKHNLWSGQ